MQLKEKEAQIIEELRLIPDAYERLGYLVEYSKKVPKLNDSLKLDGFKIEGCLSQLWIVPEFKDQKCYFKSESDSSIVHGIAGLLCDFFSDQPPKEILNNDATFLEEVGINQHLSPNRRNGLSKIVESIHRFAKSCDQG
ncbi:MAG: SufE family protein [Coraliomargaritaceae bacterium]|jgi:cysteine desulfuration protein SufE